MTNEWDSDEVSAFELHGREPHSWLENATTLKKAADLVSAELRPIIKERLRGVRYRQDVRLYKPFMLLSGLAIESVLKGIFVGERPETVSMEKIEGSWGHNLRDLALKCDIDCSEIEVDLLDRLHTFVLWKGRYPIPKKASKFDERCFRLTDIETIDRLFGRLRDILIKKTPLSTIDFRY